MEAAAPAGVTTTLFAPVVRPAGTVQVIEVALQALVAAVTPPTVTLPEAPRFEPVTTSVLPAMPVVGKRLVSTGADAGGASTVKASALEDEPPAGVTVTVVAPGARLAGTVAVTLVELQAVVVAVVAPNLTAPEAPRLEPAITTVAPGCACAGVREVMAGAATGAGTVMP